MELFIYLGLRIAMVVSYFRENCNYGLMVVDEMCNFTSLLMYYKNTLF